MSPHSEGYQYNSNYLNGKRVIHSTTNFPKCQDWKRDIVCYDYSKLSSLASLGIFQKGKEELNKKGVRFSFLLMYCQASSQNYHILTYVTDRGLIRINVYYYSGHLVVTESRTLDNALVVNRDWGSKY